MNYFEQIKLNNIKYNFNTKRGHFPFIKNTREENITSLFLEAITSLRKEDAKKYISKSLVNIIDFEELFTFFKEVKKYKFVDDISYDKKPKNCYTILVSCGTGSKSSIINMYLINEPDKYSKWKIYAIDKEKSISMHI